MSLHILIGIKCLAVNLVIHKTDFEDGTQRVVYKLKEEHARRGIGT